MGGGGGWLRKREWEEAKVRGESGRKARGNREGN